MKKIEKLQHTEQDSPARQLRSVLQQKGIIISRVPQKTKEAFKAIAKEEFCDDYGMLLKWLIENSYLIQPILGRMDEFENRLLKLENSNPEEDAPKSVKMMGGNEIK